MRRKRESSHRENKSTSRILLLLTIASHESKVEEGVHPAAYYSFAVQPISNRTVSSIAMKFTTSAIVSLSLAASVLGAEDSLSSSDSPPHLRTATATAFQQSACNDIKDEHKCMSTKDEGGTGKSCVWCDCQAVPSVCVTVRMIFSIDSRHVCWGF